MNEDIIRRVGELDERVIDVDIALLLTSDAPRDSAVTEENACLIAAMASAALAAAEKAGGLSSDIPLNDRKTRIDGAATSAAENIFERAHLRIKVAAGEGERDSSPGAHSGQVMGSDAADAPVVDGVFDYVDGTELAATLQPGALALGSLGAAVRKIPDLQAYSLLAPVGVLQEIDIMGNPEEQVMPALNHVADSAGKNLNELVVSTHSVSSNPMHHSLIHAMRAQGVEVLVPEQVTVEPPYLLSLVGLSVPKIDSMVGAIGFSELAFAATLVDLMAPEMGFVFRSASISGPRARTSEDLSVLFEFSADESNAFAADGWDTKRQYTSADLVQPGSSRVAALFCVTENSDLDLRAPTADVGRTRVEGLLVEPAGAVSKITVSYTRQADA